MELTKLQNELKGKDVTYRGYELLLFLKKTYFQNFKGVELQKLRPLQFGESKYVKQAFEELESANIISGIYKNGIAMNIVPNIPMLMEMEKADSVIQVVKSAPVKKEKKERIIPEVVKDIFKHYNSYPLLPRPSTMTELAITRTVEKLKIYSPEQIKEAIDVVSEAKWVINKASDPWMNYSWIMNVIEEFMEGGKYATVRETTTATRQTTMDNDTEIFW